LNVAVEGEYAGRRLIEVEAHEPSGGTVMSRKRSSFAPPADMTLRIVASAPADEGAAQIIEVLQEHLRLVRDGLLRSLAIVSVSHDGASIGTQWSCGDGDSVSLIGKLTVLTHDLMASRE
jgi:hypothetical protein